MRSTFVMLTVLCLWAQGSAAFVYNGVTAHRGNSSEQPENTIAAFQSALDAGADRIEMDIHRTMDGELVIIHDVDTARVGDITLVVASNTLSALRTVDVAHAFRQARGLSFGECPVMPMPTLTEALVLVTNQSDTKLTLHLNSDITSQVVDEVISIGASDWVEFHDGDADRLILAKQAGFRVSWGLGGAADITSCVAIASQNGFETLVLYQNSITPGRVWLIHNAGLEVGAWTVNGTASMSNHLVTGVERLFTDEPRALMAIKNADSDADTLPDYWELRYFANTTNSAAADADNDGQPNDHEYLAGTSPTDPGSCLAVEGMAASGSTNMLFTWPSEYGRRYAVSTCSALGGTWTNQPTLYDATPPMNDELVAIPTGTVAFVRIKLIAP